MIILCLDYNQVWPRNFHPKFCDMINKEIVLPGFINYDDNFGGTPDGLARVKEPIAAPTAATTSGH